MAGKLGKLAAKEVTHGVTAVAELKLSPELCQTHDHVVTHGVTAVAELKPYDILAACICTMQSPTASPPWPN